MAGKDTIYNDLDKSEESGGGCYIPWVNNSVAINGDPIPDMVVLPGAYLANYFRLSYIFSSVCRYIFISNYPESLSYWDPLFLDAFFDYLIR